MFEKAEKIKKACPVCGKMHTLVKYHHKRILLDGIPDLPIEKHLAQYAMCDQCGCVYHHKSSTHDDLVNTVNSEEYQKVWKSDTNPTLKKLLLMQFYEYSFANVSHLLFHYHRERNEMQQANTALLDAINYIHRDRVHTYAWLTPQNCKILKLRQPLQLHDDMFLIDLYRQNGQFSEAMQLVADFKGRDYFGDATDIMCYLNYEADLINTKNAKAY